MSYVKVIRNLVESSPLILVLANVILLDQEDRILLEHRSDNGCWGIPGGFLELGESLEQAAIRELKEETGLVANDLYLFRIYSGTDFYYQYPNGDEVYHVVSTYICSNYKGTLKGDGSEVRQLKFFNLNSLPICINPYEKTILKDFLVDYEETKGYLNMQGIIV